MSIFFRYSPVPVVLSQAFDTSNSRDETGNLVNVNFPNQWGDFLTSFATSGWISLAASGDIYLNTPNYVNASGLKVNTIYAQTYSKIDSIGAILPLYSGTTSGLLYKSDDNNLSVADTYIYNTDFNKITIPEATVGKLLYVGHGYDRGNTNALDTPTKEIDTYDFITLNPTVQEGDVTTLSSVVFTSALVNIASGIQIGPNYEGFSGRVLTHMGADTPALWKDANFLPEGVELIRYPKRPVYIENDRIIFYTENPSWAADLDQFSQAVLETEYDISDTVELIDEAGNRSYVKLTDTKTFITYDPPCGQPCEADAQWSDIIATDTILDPIDNEEYPGIVLGICPTGNYTGIGYAFSVKKGAYLNIVTADSAASKARFSCDGNDANSPFTFKPSTVNTLSIRPTVHTSFNQVAEDIDFVVYGKRTVEYDNYDPTLFDLDANNLPAGLIPSLRVDASIPYAVSGHPTGVYFTKYLDREKLQPSGWGFDESARVIINSKNAYSVASLPSGEVTLQTYANLTVSGITYSDYLLTREIYLLPKPLLDGSSEYVANAVLMLNEDGKIISKKPTPNPIKPTKPLNLKGVTIHDADGAANNEVSIQWDEPENDGGSEIVAYIIQFSANNGDEWTTLPNVLTLDVASATQRSATIGNLSLETPYIFRVAAQNAIGVSDYSDPSDTFYSDASVPGKPENFESRRYFDETELSEINLTWTAGHSGSSAIIGYVLEESIDGGNTWLYYNLPSNPIVNLYETITGTNAATDYVYRISAWNSNGQSAYAYLSVPGNYTQPEDPTEELSNWDFGTVLFTGVCA